MKIMLNLMTHTHTQEMKKSWKENTNMLSVTICRW